MKKRAQIELAILLAVGLVVVIGGTIYVGSIIAGSSTVKVDGRYVGDLNTHFVYDTTKCFIQTNNLVLFNSLEQAHSLKFNDAPNCV